LKYKLDIPHTITPRSIWHPKLSRNWFQSYQNCHISIYKIDSLQKKELQNEEVGHNLSRVPTSWLQIIILSST
jgi:hypothetical protein